MSLWTWNLLFLVSEWRCRGRRLKMSSLLQHLYIYYFVIFSQDNESSNVFHLFERTPGPDLTPSGSTAASKSSRLGDQIPTMWDAFLLKGALKILYFELTGLPLITHMWMHICPTSCRHKASFIIMWSSLRFPFPTALLKLLSCCDHLWIPVRRHSKTSTCQVFFKLEPIKLWEGWWNAL